MKIDARALYDYAARSDKELSFKRGDTLQVIEKTPDSNWWDGFLQGRRGFIPVSYVEIVELQPMDVPAPPKRKSSMAFGDDEGEKEAIERACVSPITEEMVSGGTTAVGTTAVVPTAEQESSGSSSSTTSPTDIKKEEDSGDLPTPSDLAAFQLPPLEDEAAKTEETKLESENQGRDSSSSKPDVLATSAPSSSTVFSSGKVDFLSASSSGSSSLPPPAPLSIPRSNTGNVSKLLSQFKEKQEQQKVLVEPHNTHRRQHSADMVLRKTESPTDINRSGSTSSSSTSAKPGVVTKPAPPPPIKPKPHLLPSGDGLFPIVPHHSSSISPLQRAAMVGQTAGGPKKPPPPQQQQKQSRGSVKVKREKSQRKDEHHLAKAGAAMKSPPADKTAADLHAELEAVAKARKRDL